MSVPGLSYILEGANVGEQLGRFVGKTGEGIAVGFNEGEP